jgi:hypothetical protein
MPIYYFSLISFPKGHDGFRWDKFTPYVLLVIYFLLGSGPIPHAWKKKEKKKRRRNQRRTYKLLVRTPRNKKVSLLWVDNVFGRLLGKLEINLLNIMVGYCRFFYVYSSYKGTCNIIFTWWCYNLIIRINNIKTKINL